MRVVTCPVDGTSSELVKVLEKGNNGYPSKDFHAQGSSRLTQTAEGSSPRHTRLQSN